MKPTLDHSILSSFKEYLDYKILYTLNAFDNRTLTLFPDTTDSRLSQTYGLYSSGKPQWVYDNSIVGANVPTVISHSTGTHGRGDDNMRFDFKNGRVIMDRGTALTGVSVECATKRFNSYLATSADDRLFVNTLFERQPSLDDITAHVKGDSYFGPCYFVKFGTTVNEGFSFGGADKTIFNIKVVVLTRGDFEVVALGGAMRDLTRTCFRVLDTTPIDEFGDLKTVGWDYETAPRNVSCHIDEVSFNVINNGAILEKYSSVHAAVANFKIFTVRNPRG